MSCGSSPALTQAPKQPRKEHEMAPSPLFRTSPLLAQAGFTHGFFLRRGGLYSGVRSSMNFTTTKGDSAENVAGNVAFAGKGQGLDPKKIYFLSQVHGTDCVVVDGSEHSEEVLATEGDVVLTRTSG